MGGSANMGCSYTDGSVLKGKKALHIHQGIQSEFMILAKISIQSLSVASGHDSLGHVVPCTGTGSTRATSLSERCVVGVQLAQSSK